MVEIPQPLADAGVDTAGVKILCQGRARPDGHDYRVLDGNGKPVPFQVLFHDANRYSLLAFRASNPKQTFYIYFGNPKADRAAAEIVVESRTRRWPSQGRLDSASLPGACHDRETQKS